MCVAIISALCRDVDTANRDRDFRFWPLSSGEEIDDRELIIRVVETTSLNERTRIYNYRRNQVDVKPGAAIYLLARRGHMRFMKQSRLTNDTRWEKWIADFNQIVDLPIAAWGKAVDLHAFVSHGESRQCRHFPDSIPVRLQYPGGSVGNESGHRMSGYTSRKSVLTDEQRRERKTVNGHREIQSGRWRRRENRNAWSISISTPTRPKTTR